MLARYAPVEFLQLWSDETRYLTWLEVLLAASSAMEHAMLIPPGITANIRTQRLALNPARIMDLEQTTRHEMMAFLIHIEELAGADARWLHRGMTSSDVTDTCFALLLLRATDAIQQRLQVLIDQLDRTANEHAATPMMGRSHGVHAEPTTFGIAIAGHLAEMKRSAKRMATARAEVAFGKLSGAVGTYAHLCPAVEERALHSLGLSPETISTQIVPRDRHAAFFSALALVAAGIERLALNIRHWQRTEVGEVHEGVAKGQCGSSAMPHKRNPIWSENICGLARVMRGYTLPVLESVALWHERDISHSSVERIVAPDATATLAFMLDRAASLMQNLVVNAPRMRQNLEQQNGLCFSEAVLLALVDKGMARHAAHAVVQKHVSLAVAGSTTLQESLEADSEIIALIPASELAAAFDLDHALRHAHEIVARARN